MANLEEFAAEPLDDRRAAGSQLRNPAPDPNDRDKADRRRIVGEFSGVDSDKGT